MTDNSSIDRPLSGIRVIGLEQYIAGPYATMLLGDAGAEVIKIERPGRGDPRRQMPPFAEKNGEKKAGGFMGYNRNKKSLALDLRQPDGQEIFRKLCQSADVVVENIRPGSMDKQGLGYQDMRKLNPHLIWAAISGFGRLPGKMGPYADRPAFDLVAEAMSGMMNLVGYPDKPPAWTVYGLADIVSGIMASYGITQALYMRERTGQGQFVDSAMFDNLLALNETMVSLYSVTGREQTRGVPSVFFPRGAYETQDGQWVAIHVPDDILWQRLADAMGRADLIEDARSATSIARAENHAFLDGIIQGFFKSKTQADVIEYLNSKSVPTAPVYTAKDIFDDPHVAARGTLMEVDDPKVGAYTFARTAPMMETNPDLPAEPAPDLGQHTRAVLIGLGYSDGDVDSLAKAGVVGLAE